MELGKITETTYTSVLRVELLSNQIVLTMMFEGSLFLDKEQTLELIKMLNRGVAKL